MIVAIWKVLFDTSPCVWKKNLHVICYAFHFICSWSFAGLLFVHVARLLCFLLLEDKCKMSWFPYGWIQSQCKGDTMTTMITHIKQQLLRLCDKMRMSKATTEKLCTTTMRRQQKKNQNIKRQKQIRWQCNSRKTQPVAEYYSGERIRKKQILFVCVCVLFFAVFGISVLHFVCFSYCSIDLNVRNE